MWIGLSDKTMEVMNMSKKWECKQCGKCCQFIVIPVAEEIDIETKDYLEAHGIAVDGNKLVIPARCEHLQRIPGIPRKYNCMIHTNKYVNCRLGGEKECNDAKRCYALLRPSPRPSPVGEGVGGGVTK
jgi:Fe-S-cluster containining protein